MSIPKTPIKYGIYRSLVKFFSEDGNKLSYNDIARDLTAYYTLLKKQEECGKTGHVKEVGDGISLRHCCKCGADLTKGAKT